MTCRYKTKESYDNAPLKTTFRYYCAQSCKEQQRQKADPQKIRGTMDIWECNGYLSVRIETENLASVILRYSHNFAHQGYNDIALPEQAIEHIRSRKDRTPGELYNELRVLSPVGRYTLRKSKCIPDEERKTRPSGNWITISSNQLLCYCKETRASMSKQCLCRSNQG